VIATSAGQSNLFRQLVKGFLRRLVGENELPEVNARMRRHRCIYSKIAIKTQGNAFFPLFGMGLQ
jgi:hypothetical protein